MASSRSRRKDVATGQMDPALGETADAQLRALQVHDDPDRPARSRLDLAHHLEAARHGPRGLPWLKLKRNTSAPASASSADALLGGARRAQGWRRSWHNGCVACRSVRVISRCRLDRQERAVTSDRRRPRALAPDWRGLDAGGAARTEAATRRRPGAAHLASIALDPADAAPLHRQLYLGLRDGDPGRPPAAGRAPAVTRRLGRRSRRVAQHGDGGVRPAARRRLYRGCHGLGLVRQPRAARGDAQARARLSGRDAGARPRSPRRAAERSAALATPPAAPRPFAPACRSSRLSRSRNGRGSWPSTGAAPRSFLIGGDPAGHPSLREAIAAYLGAARAVSCNADQVFVVTVPSRRSTSPPGCWSTRAMRVWVEDRAIRACAGLCSPLVPAGAGAGRRRGTGRQGRPSARAGHGWPASRPRTSIRWAPR